MRVKIVETPQQVAHTGADIILDQISLKPDSVLGLATGSSPIKLYENLIAAYESGKVSFSKVTTFNLDEYLGLHPEHCQSYRYFMQKKLFDHIDICPEATHVPDGISDNPYLACEQYEQRIKQHKGIDVQLLGIGSNGHIGFNEPSSSLSSRTRVKTLTKSTIIDNSRYFKADEFQPELAITMGIGTIMEAERLVLLACGKEKAAAIQSAIEGPISTSCPASILQMHKNVIVVIDSAASGRLRNREFYIEVEEANQKLISSITKAAK